MMNWKEFENATAWVAPCWDFVKCESGPQALTPMNSRQDFTSVGILPST